MLAEWMHPEQDVGGSNPTFFESSRICFFQFDGKESQVKKGTRNDQFEMKNECLNRSVSK